MAEFGGPFESRKMEVDLAKITVRNKLPYDITDVRVVYGAGNKKQAHSTVASEYWFDWKTVNLETGTNVVYTRDQTIGEIKSGSDKSATGFSCSTYFWGYWQVMWKDQGSGKPYKINKNNAQVNVWEMDKGGELEITILKETDYIRVDFKLTSGNAYFYAA